MSWISYDLILDDMQIFSMSLKNVEIRDNIYHRKKIVNAAKFKWKNRDPKGDGYLFRLPLECEGYTGNKKLELRGWCNETQDNFGFNIFFLEKPVVRFDTKIHTRENDRGVLLDQPHKHIGFRHFDGNEWNEYNVTDIDCSDVGKALWDFCKECKIQVKGITSAEGFAVKMTPGFAEEILEDKKQKVSCNDGKNLDKWIGGN
jgi:hypothetical protein